MPKKAVKKRWEATDFAKILRKLRDQKGWTQAELARNSELHMVTISKLENGYHEPSWPLVCKLCDALDVSANKFRLPRDRKGIKK